MKSAIALVASTLFSAAALGQDKPAAQAADAQSLQKANQLVTEVAQAYKQAKALTDVINIQTSAPPGDENRELTISVGSGNDAMIGLGGFSIVAVDGKLHIVRDDVPDKFFAADLEGDLPSTLESVLGSKAMLVPPHIAMRNELSEQQRLASLVMFIHDDPKLAGHQMAKTEDGAEAHELLMTIEGGKASVLVDPQSKLVRRVAMEFTPPQAPENFVVKITLSMSPKVHDALPTPIAFNGGGRTRVETLQELAPTPIAAGQPAPDFTLATLSGETVTLSSLKGSVVVLDFWATWCGPCRRALPLMQEFATWAESSQQPIKVYAVNVWERFKSSEEIKAKVGEFWTSKNYTMPTLLDLDNAAVTKYGFDSIPTTVVVGPDGKVFKIHSGNDANMVEALKKDAADALAKTG